MEMRAHRIASLLAALVVAGGLTSAQVGRGWSDWPTPYADAQRTSWLRSDPNISVESMSKPGFELQWTSQLDDQPRAPHGLTQGVTVSGVTLFVPTSLVAGSANRLYMLDNDKVKVAFGPLSNGALPMSHGLTRLQNRFLAKPEHGKQLATEMPTLAAVEADEQGLCTYLLDPVDWADDVRIALEERVSMSPDALTGMEASLRFGGAENCDSKIFGRLSAWQNWIFTRPNATGDEGALTRYGAPESAKFDWRRT